MIKKTGKTVLRYLDGEIESARLHKSETTILHHLRARRSFALFLERTGLDDLRLPELTPRLMAGYQHYLRRRGLCRNTTSFYMRNLRVLFARGVSKGKISPDLFCQVYTGVAPTRKRAVSDDIIRRLVILDIPKAFFASRRTVARFPLPGYIYRLTLARDLFLFSFYTCGMPFIDIAHLTRANLAHDTIRYSRRKTNQQIEIGILPETQRIIDKYRRPGTRYLFPILSEGLSPDDSLRTYESALRHHNRLLQKLSQLIGSTTSLSSYVSRHTWATTASRHSVSLPVISQALGHNSEHTTKIYLQSLESSEVSEANRKLLESVLCSNS